MGTPGPINGGQHVKHLLVNPNLAMTQHLLRLRVRVVNTMVIGLMCRVSAVIASQRTIELTHVKGTNKQLQSTQRKIIMKHPPLRHRETPQHLCREASDRCSNIKI
jgi:hypothetical protein